MGWLSCACRLYIDYTSADVGTPASAGVVDQLRTSVVFGVPVVVVILCHSIWGCRLSGQFVEQEALPPLMIDISEENAKYFPLQILFGFFRFFDIFVYRGEMIKRTVKCS